MWGRFWFYDGVAAFFMISGYFVFASAERLTGQPSGIAIYLTNRALRVIPLVWTYLVAAVLITLIVGAASFRDLASGDGALWLLSTLAMVPVYSPDFLDSFGVGVVNGSLWTIPVEVSFYLLVPLLVAWHVRMRRPAFTGTLLTLSAAFFVVARVMPESAVSDLVDLSFAPYLWYFALGIAAHLHRDRLLLSWPAAAVSAAGYVIAHSVLTGATGLPDGLLELAAAPLLGYAILVVGERGHRMLGQVTSRVGDLSYGIYVWHMLVVNTMLWVGTRRPSGAADVVVAITITVLLAAASWWLIERQALRLKRRPSR